MKYLTRPTASQTKSLTGCSLFKHVSLPSGCIWIAGKSFKWIHSYCTIINIFIFYTLYFPLCRVFLNNALRKGSSIGIGSMQGILGLNMETNDWEWIGESAWGKMSQFVNSPIPLILATVQFYCYVTLYFGTTHHFDQILKKIQTHGRSGRHT